MGNWAQKVVPFLDDSKLVVYSNGKLLYDWYEWCLAVTDAAFGVAPFAASAIKAWEVNNTKHCNLNFPERVFFPLFWRGGKYGHVAIAYCENGRIKIWSSPYTHKPYFDYFESTYSSTYAQAISTIEGKYGMKEFIGWTETLGDKRLIQWEESIEVNAPIVEPTPEPEPVPEKEPATEESSAEPVQVNSNKNDDVVVVPMGNTKAEVLPTVANDGVQKVTQEQFEKLMEENITYMEKFQEIVTEAGNGITFKPITKKVVYIICDLLLLAGAEVNPIITALHAESIDMFATALTQALFTAGVGGLLIFKLLKAKGGVEKTSETIDKIG